MNSRNARLALIPLVVAIAVIAFVIAKPSSSGKNQDRTVTHIVVRGAKPVGGIRTIKVTKGHPVRFSVTSDVADEIHVHGYDFHKEVAKGGTVSFDFPAKIDGSFVIELEHRSEQIASLQVQP